MQRVRRPAEILAATGLFDRARAEEILQLARARGHSVVETVVREKHALEEDFLRGLAKAMEVPFFRADEIRPDRETLERLPTATVFHFNVVPAALEDGALRIVVADPFRPGLADALRLAAGREVRFALAPAAEIAKAAKRLYGVGADTLDAILQDQARPLEIAPETELFNKDIDDLDQEASVVKFVNQIVWEAYQDGATDIHLEPQENDLRVRYRIDGVLHPTPVPPQLKRFQSAIISRVKVMAGMDIAEKRLPQDGRIGLRIRGEELDVRVSTMPTVYGESVSLRLLLRRSGLLGMDKLGLSAEDEALLKRLIARPHGILLVTGPTGSGKSTSLYAWLHTINSTDKRILTIEEPIEYEMPGINQIQVKPEIGFTFAVGLRHILRQDPNVVMVGEIRDLETAEIAIRASLTGHLVFSTLHTNDAPSAFTRLIDMGIEPFLVASSVEAVMAQRLVRLVCPECRAPQAVEPRYLLKIGFPRERIESARFFKGAGCDACRFLGYQGRTGIYELLVVTESMRPLIMNRAPASNIAAHAIAEGMKTLRMAGWERVLHPERPTTIEEVLRVTQVEEHLAALLGDEKN